MGKNPRLEKLYRLSIAIGTTLDLDHEVAAFMDWLIREVGPSLAALFITDEAKQKLQLAGAHGFEPPANTLLPMGLDLWRWLMEQGAFVPKEGAPHRYAVPIPIERQLWGTLCLVSSHASDQLAEEQRLVSTAAGYLAPVLRNIWRCQTLEQQVAERTADLENTLQRLRESEENYRILTESSPAGIILLREDKILYANPTVLDFFGQTLDNITGRSVFDFIYPDDRGQAATYAEQWRMGKRKRELTLRFQTPQGPRYVELRLAPVQYKGEASTLVMAIDITERLQAEMALKQAREEMLRVMQETVQALAYTIELRDPYTAGHQRRVADLACAIAKEIGLSEEQIEGLRLAATIHDIGKMQVPIEILSKPEKLNEIEFDIIKTHPQVGYDVLKTIEFPWPVAQIVLQHHERMDGSGYPQGLLGEEIILEARILAVADVVEAMASDRPYRPALGIDKALEDILQNKGILYDTEVVDACNRLFTEKGFKLE